MSLWHDGADKKRGNYASQTIQAFTCGFTDAAQLCIGKLSFRALHRNPLKYRNFLQYQKIAYKSI